MYVIIKSFETTKGDNGSRIIFWNLLPLPFQNVTNESDKSKRILEWLGLFVQRQPATN